MPFAKGQSGNKKGRPKRLPSQAGSVKAAFDELIKEKPDLIREAFERGLEGKRSLGYLELGAKLGREIGNQGEGHQQIAIIFASPLDTAKLRPGAQTVRVIEVEREKPQELQEAPTAENAELLEVVTPELVLNGR